MAEDENYIDIGPIKVLGPYMHKRNWITFFPAHYAIFDWTKWVISNLSDESKNFENDFRG